jgi:hypothetical protein
VDDCPLAAAIRAGERGDELMWAIFDDMAALPREGFCRHGHPRTPENTLVDRGGRRCRPCKNEQQRRNR